MEGFGGGTDDPLWPDAQLWVGGAEDRPAQGRARRRTGLAQEPIPHRHPLPPRDQIRWHARRLCRPDGPSKKPSSCFGTGDLIEIGIVGLPNVGKSSLFNALTGAAAAVENFPFTTIEPNIGVVPLPDVRLHRLAKEWSSAKVTPAGIRFVDIAGIVKGASEGQGLGNKFLAHIRSVDAIARVVRCFKDDNVVNIMSELNPQSAVDIIETELLLADIQQCQKALDKHAKPAKGGDKDAMAKCNALNDAMKAFNDGKPARALDLPKDILDEFQFLTGKPLLYVANTDEGEPDEGLLAPLRDRASKEGAALVTLCTKLEAEIVQLPSEKPSP